MWGYEVIPFRRAREAFEAFRKGGIDLVVSDIKMPELTGIELLAMIHEIDPEFPVILMTAFADLETAVDAVRKGAFDLILKPAWPDDLQAAIEKGIRFRRLIGLEKQYTVLLEEKVREAESNLQAAAVIQRSLLPISVPEVPSFDFAWLFRPCKQIGGDLLSLFPLDETHLGAFVMDVSGHGVPAAMVNTLVAQTLNPLSSSFLKRFIATPPFYEPVLPGEVLARLNREFPFERFEEYLTLCYLLLDTRSGKVRYSNAALPLPFLVRADGRVENLGAGGAIIGMGEGVGYEEGEFIMEQGDRLFLYTDGIVEHRNKQGDFYGAERLVMELLGAAGETLQAVCARVMPSLTRFGDDDPEDDITLLGIEFRQPG